jgi:ferredoxin
MKLKEKRVLLCNCEGTMPIDAKALAKSFDQEPAFVFSQLCRSQQSEFKKALGEGDLLVACGREAPLFEELRAELGEAAPEVSYVDIREKAGWGTDAKKSTPKIAALLAEASLAPNLVENVMMSSKGTILIYGGGEVALEAAKMLRGRLSPVVVLTDTGHSLVPLQSDIPIFKGRVSSAKGHLGDFNISFNQFAPISPSSKGGLSFAEAQNDIKEEFDLILDVSDGTGFFPSNQKRDGYVKISSTDKAGLFKALFDLSDMVGDFSKPRYTLVDEKKCAHARNRITGCRKCIDACSVSAIIGVDNAISIDPYICEGCGDCSAVCPTGAISYEVPSLDHTHRRLQTMISTYLKSGGENPILFVHDTKQGEEALNMLGQIGVGLPADVIPFALNSISTLDHGLFLAAIAYGAGGVVVLAPSSDYESAKTTTDEIALAQALLEGFKQNTKRFHIIDHVTPDYIGAELTKVSFPQAPKPMTGLAVGSKRQRNRIVLNHLQGTDSAIFKLPTGAPYGQVVLDLEACSMCMACVSACPTTALRANQDAPILSFIEQDCVQCGICKATCPEKAISLVARLNLDEAASRAQVLKEDQPAICTECGKTYGTQSSVDTIVGKLSKMPQFANSEMLVNLRKCEDCRVIAIAGQHQPLKAGDRPKPRTADDYRN